MINYILTLKVLNMSSVFSSNYVLFASEVLKNLEEMIYVTS